MGTRTRKKELKTLRKLPLLAVPLVILGIVLLVIPSFQCVKGPSGYNHSIRFRSPNIVPLEISAKDLQEAREKVEQVCQELEDRYNGLYEFDSEGIHLKVWHQEDTTWFSDYYITNPQPSPNQKTWKVKFRSFTVTSIQNETREHAEPRAIKKNEQIRDKLKDHLAIVEESLFPSVDDGSG